MVFIPIGYSPLVPPPKISDNPHIFVISVNITSIRELSLSKSTFTVDVTISLKWKDSRLRFTNLRSQPKMNIVNDYSSVWLPTLLCHNENNTPADIRINQESLFILKEASSLPDDDSIISEGKLIK